jgi:hypothetical protein
MILRLEGRVNVVSGSIQSDEHEHPEVRQTILYLIKLTRYIHEIFVGFIDHLVPTILEKRPSCLRADWRPHHVR